jgi:glyoxylase-like metal-dependent hydrolase (beta-lactamase superfamily II)
MAEELHPGLRLVRAPNPSPLTGTGTNSWIIGTGALVVIDPGPALPAHLAALLAAIGQARVEAILVTHAHLDHSALAPALSRATGAPILAHALLDGIPTAPPDAGEGLDRAFRPDMALADGATWRGAPGEIRALHTPGHLHDHLCLLWEGMAFSGDHVMGWASSVISPPEGDMGAYMTSLDRLAAAKATCLLPGHGDKVTDPSARIAALTAHRRAREAAILAALAAGPAPIAALVARLYADTPPALHPAAARNVLAHLLDLHHRNEVTALPAPGLAALWRRSGTGPDGR